MSEDETKVEGAGSENAEAGTVSSESSASAETAEKTETEAA